MNLELCEVDDFEPSSEFNRDWWHSDGDTSLRFTSDGVEVARVKVGKPTGLRPHAGAPNLETIGLQIVRIEVALSKRQRGLGIGTQVVDQLVDRFPTHRLYGLSVKDAEGFWSKVGWERYPHPELLTLYVQPFPERKNK